MVEMPDKKKCLKSERPTFTESMAEIIGPLGIGACICLLVLGVILAVTYEDGIPDISPIVFKDMFPYVLIITVAMQCFTTGLLFLGLGRALHYLRRIAVTGENDRK